MAKHQNVLSEPFLGQLSERTAQIHDEKTTAEPSELVLEMKALVEKDPYTPENWVQLGRAYRRQQMHREAIDAYSQGITYEPFYGLFYRHRGHAYMNISRWNEAVADFTFAIRLMPDNRDSWYHLGATYFMLGDYPRAEYAYKRSLELSENLRMKINSTDWYWMILMRQGKTEEARRAVDEIPDTITEAEEEGGGKDYHSRIQLYKGIITAEEFERDLGHEDKEIITKAFGLANYYYVTDDEENGNRIVRLILKEGEPRYWSAFGYQCAVGEKLRRDL